MHSLVRKVKRQDELWLVGPGRAWSHRQTQAGPCALERLPGKLQAADKKEEQHLAFSERDQECQLSAL